ncbi:hypothetical protein CEXT_241261 [Caerostris extrusa]|uniref:Uncharacterized protein n=1 Tax=Caerostris extrusa TaxID=172846 RepID=A0AAV4WLX9_CAEEX|nr:hypothetical protein CEXT_241261 [Caerostris extrusa]
MAPPGLEPEICGTERQTLGPSRLEGSALNFFHAVNAHGFRLGGSESFAATFPGVSPIAVYAQLHFRLLSASSGGSLARPIPLYLFDALMDECKHCLHSSIVVFIIHCPL